MRRTFLYHDVHSTVRNVLPASADAAVDHISVMRCLKFRFSSVEAVVSFN
jgi:hypothetical protein